MPVFVTSKTSTNRHGVFAISRVPPPVLQLPGTGVAAMVGQFPWGRDQVLVVPTSPRDLLNEFAPPGMDHTGSGYMAVIRKPFAELDIVRVLGSSAGKSTATLTTAGPTNLMTVEAKYKGSAGDSLVASVSLASDGDANHFNLTVTVSGASGSTTDIFKNLNISGVGDDALPTATDFNNALLVGALTKLAAGVPDVGTYTFSGGSNGTINSGAYCGTAGTGDKGIALFEGSARIRHICSDDCGDSLRAAVNAALEAQAIALGDRVAYINGNNGLSQSATATDAASYRSTRVVYVDPWVYVLDDVDGTQRAVPPGGWAAMVASRVSPSTSIAWKNSEVGDMLVGINALVVDRGAAVSANTDAGVVTIINEPTGGFRFECDLTTNAPADPSKKSLRRTRVGDAIALAFVSSVRGLVDAPNVEVNRQALITALNGLLTDLKRAQDVDPEHRLFIVDFTTPVVGSSDAEIQAGQVEIDTAVKVGAAMEQIFLGIAYGETVTITAQ